MLHQAGSVLTGLGWQAQTKAMLFSTKLKLTQASHAIQDGWP